MLQPVLRVLFCCLISAAVYAQNGHQTFTNPLLPSGADPWSIFHNGYYYYTHTLGDRIVIWKTNNIGLLRDATKKTIWVPPTGTMWSKQIWAPEIHFLDNKWYVYFAADNGNNNTHRLYVLENSSPDPMQGEWLFKGKIADSSDKWAIDGSVFEHNDQLYIVWSGWQGDENRQQDLYIGKMKDPLTIEGPRFRISSPAYNWERHGDLNDPNNPPHVAVNEGPQVLKKDDKLFIVYSASGCWTEHYSLGMLTIDADANLLDSASWIKSQQPVFKSFGKNGVYAAGHNSFFSSPDGKENWILYHANDAPGQGCGKFRSPRAQRFTWSKQGTPVFGDPVKTGEPIPVPSDVQKKPTLPKPKKRVPVTG